MRIRLNKKIDFMKLVYEVYSEPNYTVVDDGYDSYYRCQKFTIIDKKNDRKIAAEYKPEALFETVIAYLCPNCGCEAYNQWKDENLETSYYSDFPKVRDFYNQIAEKEVKDTQNLSVCPVCGEPLSRNMGYYIEGHTGFVADSFGIPFNKTANNEPVVHHDGRLRSRFWQKTGNIDVYFEEMKIQREIAENIMFKEKVDDNISLWSDIAISSASNGNVEEIKSNTEKLKEHLLHLIKLEMNIYSLSKRLQMLYSLQLREQRLINSLKHSATFERINKKAKIKDYIIECEKKRNLYVAGSIGIEYPIRPTEPVYATPNLFNKKKVLAENEELRLKYQNAVKNYEEQVSSYESKKNLLIREADREIEKYSAELKELQQSNSLNTDITNSSLIQRKQLIDKEITEAETLLKSICECRSIIYNYDIVFIKYRDVVALSTFYEYLQAGRCTTLIGANGAYNLYEEQLRGEKIIGQLSQVISQLDEIKESQYMIYSELQKVNKNLDRLNSTMDKALIAVQNLEKDVAHISENTDVIAHNTAVTAYYSKLNTELTGLSRKVCK